MLSGLKLKYLTSILNSNFFKKAFYKFYSGGGIDGEMTIFALQKFPIPLPTPEAEQVLTILVDFILFAKEHNFEKEAQLIESVIDIVVFGLYFEDKMKETNCYILPRLSETIRPLEKNSSFSEKVKYIKTLYNFFLKDSKILRGLIYSYLIEDVKIINEK